MASGTRLPLHHDWTQGNYIEGGVLEGRVDWDHLETLEIQSLDIIEKTVDEFDTVTVHFSGGLDVLVVAHMLTRLGIDDVKLVNCRSIEQFPSAVEYVQGIADAFGLPLVELVTEEHDMEWVKENEDDVLWPTWEQKDQLYGQTYRRAAHEYQVENNVDAYLTGRRNEHNSTPDTIVRDKDAYDRLTAAWPQLDEHVSWQINPINTWNFEYVISYLDKYSIPIMLGYNGAENGCEYPWHRAASVRGDGPQHSDEEMWYNCREMTVRYGYTDFWTDHILQHYPEGEELASIWASDNDLDLLSIDKGYDHGADSQPVPYPCGPASDKP